MAKAKAAASKKPRAKAAAGKAAPAAEPETIRAFVALDLDTLSLRRVARLSDRLRMSSGAPSATWTPVSKLHVTLKFAAHLPLSAVEPLGKALEALVVGKEAPAACALRLEGFPNKEEAEVVVAELADTRGDIARLAARVEKLVGKYGVPDDERAYRPHVTLAHLRMAYDGRRWLRSEYADVAGDCRAGGLTLYRSIPGPESARSPEFGLEHHGEGSTYVPLARFAYSTSTQTS